MSSAPTSEIGSTTDLGSLPGWGSFIDEREYAPDWVWPQNLVVIERMFTDAQVAGLKRSVELPVLRRRWSLDPMKASAESVQKLAEDLDLPIKGSEDEYQAATRRQNRFSFKKHLTELLKALWYGHYYFEQVGEVGDDGLWHLRKLAPRPPRTIGEIKMSKDGGLMAIVQNIGFPAPPPIPVDRLIAYIWDQDPGDWVGRSMLRACYRNWLIKDRLLRVDAIKHERTGAGVAQAEARPGASREEIEALDQLMRARKVTETGGMAVPNGTKVTLMGTAGTVPDTWASIRGNNEEMAGSFLAMFKQLGTTETGSRALGSSFIDFFSQGLDAICDWAADIFGEHMIEDWYDWNYGPDTEVPRLCHDVDVEELDALDLATLVDKGVIHVDPDLEAEIRDRFSLPELSEEKKQQLLTSPPSPPSAPEGAQSDQLGSGSDGGGGEDGGAAPEATARGDAAPSPVLLPDRSLHRQPYEHEVQAGVDFATMDADIRSLEQQLTDQIHAAQAPQIEAIHDEIVEADGDVVKLASMQVDPVAESETQSALMTAMAQGVSQALGEASRQGVQLPPPDTSALETIIARRSSAMAVQLAGSLSLSASNKAIELTGEGALEPAQVADKVREFLNGLVGAVIQQRAHAALATATLGGRKAVFRVAEAEGY